MNDTKVYISINKKKTLGKNEKIYLKDIGSVFCKDENLKSKIEEVRVYKSSEEERWDYITNVTIAEMLYSRFPSIDIEFIGMDECLLEIKSREKRKIIIEIAKVAFVSITLFFGAGLGVMYFHEDVNMIKAFERLYFSFTGEKKENPLIMAIPYSIGLGVGMLVFFMRIISTSKRRRMEPGPMDIELYLYDSEEEEYILNELKEKLPRND